MTDLTCVKLVIDAQAAAFPPVASWRATTNQVEFVVHGVTRGSMFRPVAARQPSIRWGRYWIFFSLRLMMRTRPTTSAAAKLTMDRLSSDQMPSAGFMSGAYAGSRYTRSQALFSAAKLASSGARWTLRLSQTQTRGAASWRCAAMIRSR